MNDISKLEKIVKEQAKQLDSLKKAINGLQRQLILVGKKTNRAYENGRRNTNDINSINNMLRKNR